MINNTILLCLALGWQGGTVHQVAKETGLTVQEILNTDRKSLPDKGLGSDKSFGRSSVRTCTIQHNRNVNFPKRKGNLEYWMGAADGIEMALKLGDKIYGQTYNPEERGWV